MNKNNIEKFPTKLLIICNLFLNGSPKDFDNLKLIKTYSEILKLLDSNEKDIVYFLYLNRINIQKILYDEEEFITLDIKEENRNLSFYLLKKKIEICHFIFI